MDCRPAATTLTIARTAAISGLVLLYLYGIRIAAKAIALLPIGKETDPTGHAYPPWTMIHFASALLFAVLAIVQLFPVLRRLYPLMHRYCGRVAVASGLVAALTGALIPFAVVRPQPLLERAYIVVYFTGTACLLLLGFYAARRQDFRLHRIWMIRAVATAGAVMTQRIVFPILALTFGVSSDSVFWIGFVAAFALGWAINFGLAECWLRWKPGTPAAAIG